VCGIFLISAKKEGRLRNMEKHRKMLEDWARMDSWGTVMDEEKLFTRDIPNEMIKEREKQYFDEVERRIRFCNGLLRKYEDSMLYYTLAELCNRRDVNSTLENLYQVRSRYYCKRALQFDQDNARAWALMADNYSWVALIFGVKDINFKIMEHVGKKIDAYKAGTRENGEITEKQRMVIKRIERGIFCIKQAIRIDPGNEKYRNHLNNFYQMRNQEYKPLGETRIIRKS
jgi:hypothetical protein